MSDYKFEGWLGHDKNALGNMKWEEFQPKPFEESDVDIKISHSGICGSDIHTLRSGWGATDYPCCVGHEIIGRAVKVGSNVGKGIKEGDTVGVGAQAYSCLRPDCDQCQAHEEHLCPRMAPTFDAKFPDGSKTMGGYATYNRTPGHFVFKIPSGLDLAAAAPMMCGGVTVYSPLKHNNAKGKRVGIVGVGGLGHFGVLFAKALGAKSVIGISRKNEKRDDIMKMGADDYIATDEDEGWHKKHAGSLDLIVCTVSSPKMPFTRYLQLLHTHGTFIQVGAPEDNIPGFNAFMLIAKQVKVGGSMIGSPDDIQEMLQLAADQKIKPWIVERPMKDANQAVVDMDAGKARYRYVLTN